MLCPASSVLNGWKLVHPIIPCVIYEMKVPQNWINLIFEHFSFISNHNNNNNKAHRQPFTYYISGSVGKESGNILVDQLSLCQLWLVLSAFIRKWEIVAWTEFRPLFLRLLLHHHWNWASLYSSFIRHSTVDLVGFSFFSRVCVVVFFLFAVRFWYVMSLRVK